MRTLHHQRHKIHHMLEHGCLTKQEFTRLDEKVAQTMLFASQNICFVCGAQPLEIAADLTHMTTMSSKKSVPKEYLIQHLRSKSNDLEMGAGPQKT